MKILKTYLEGGDLRSIGNVDRLVSLINTQSEFDLLFKYLFSEERLIRMRAADAIEKISAGNFELLFSHKLELIELMKTAIDKELKWHLALMISRVELTSTELRKVWKYLSKWAIDQKESKIVRVNAIQSMYELSNRNKAYLEKFKSILAKVQTENIPSINARLRKLKIKI